MLEKVEKFLDGNDNSNYKTIYIFAGINYLTSRQRSHDYEELIANEELNLRNLFEEIEQTETKLEKNKSIKIIFATIPTMNLQKWNETRKQQKRTKYLQLEERYEEMQNKINENVWEINRNFIRINTASNYYTPYIHTTIEVNVPVKRAGTRKRYNYRKLSDGIHPCDAMILQMKERFLKAINLNRENQIESSDESDKEEKRSWKY